MGSYITIGYLQSKMIRTPLHLNQTWNEDINNCQTPEEIIDYIDLYGTYDEHWQLLQAIGRMEKINLELDE